MNFVPEGQSPTDVTGGQIVSLSVNGELDNDQYDALLPVDEEEKLGAFEEEPG
jgi:hypothetical protein